MTRALLIALLALPAVALAQPGFGPPPGGPGGPPPIERLEELHLTDAQKAKLETLRGDERRKTIRLDADARIAEMDLDDAIDRGDGNTTIAPLIQRIADLRGQILATRVATRVAVRALLTPEQRAKLRALRPPPPPPPTEERRH